MAARQARWGRAGLEFVGTHTDDGNTYLTLRGDDPERAKAYLRLEPIDEPYFYVVVETPDGNWGTDIDGLYLEQLRPWQLDTSDADCRGRVDSLVDGFIGLHNAAKGSIDNYCVNVACGRCEHLWCDGIRYRNTTLVRCPNCRAANLVDSSRVTVEFR